MSKKTKNTVKATVRVGVNLPVATYRLAKLVYEMQEVNFDSQIKKLIAADINQMAASGWFTGEMIAQLEETFPFMKLNLVNKGRRTNTEEGDSDERFEGV